MNKIPLLGAAALAVIIAGCGGQNSGTASKNSSGSPTTAMLNNVTLNNGDGSSANTPTILSVPNVTAAKAFSFDLGLVDQGRYYLTDRNNASVDVFDTATNTLITQITGLGALAFAGAGATPDTSGPNGINRVTGTDKLYVGDVNSVKVVDTSTNTIIKSIAVFDANGAPTGNRSDEGCYDADHHIMMFANPADSFATWFNTDTDEVIARFDFPDNTTGLEQCAYDPNTKTFLINNDATTTNPHGELDRFSADSVLAGAPELTARYPLGNCAPTGMALGPDNDVLIGCDPAAGDPLISLIVDRTTGDITNTIPFGGVDQVAYDANSNRYYLAARHWVDTGIAATTFNPVLGIIDADSKTVIAKLAAGTNDHSVAVDPEHQQVYVPFSATKGSTLFAEGGIAVYSIGDICLDGAKDQNTGNGGGDSSGDQ